MYGPYYEEPRRDSRGRWHPGRWRVYVVDQTGKQTTGSYASEAKAKRELAKFSEGIEREALTVDRAIDMYVDYQRAKGNSEGSIKTTIFRLRKGILAPALDQALQDLNHKRAQRLYDQLAAKVETDTHRNSLGQARSFARWCVKRGYLAGNPFADVEGIGRRKAGEESKTQLTTDEARKLVAHCLAHPGRHATGALICLGLGLRASEVCRLEPADLDDDGSILIVRGTKSRSARRRLVIPEWLRPVLEGTLPIGLTRYGLRDACRRLCREAGVTETGPQGLRGTHASLAAGAGAASQLVADSLGHASPAVTERHYASRGARESGRAAKLELVKGGKG